MSTITDADLVAMHARSLRLTTDLVETVTPDQLNNETPCAGWNLRDLLTHMTIENHGFAESARGRGGDISLWQTRELADPIGEYLTVSADLLDAFAVDDISEREFLLPGIMPGVPFKAEHAVRFQLVDCVVHAWDVARSIGKNIELDSDPEMADETLAIARIVPGGADRLKEGAAFGPILEVPEGSGKLDEILLLLGRDPKWGN
ncbi:MULTISPECIES: TIGR03086 family metal-binding protein [unclassified Nocardia]|uniref:TIGR03086 family metal-binding protein n=1 Tax=unclassified Nocardia TaxID=2637762 RepID=UPI001CE43E46|nr:MULTISPECIES: TIGR03086 family metal-binding protein [unclassified Nocardia]